MKIQQVVLAFLVSGAAAAYAGPIETQVLPDKPVVITANARDVYGKSVAAPWFSFRAQTVNRSNTPVTITEMKLTIRGMDSSGAVRTVIQKYSPADFKWVRVVSSGGRERTVACHFTHFGEFAPSTGSTGYYLAGDAACPPCQEDGRSPEGNFCVPRPMFYFSGAAGGLGSEFTNWEAVLEPLGWLGTFEMPTGRLKTMTKFETQ